MLSGLRSQAHDRSIQNRYLGGEGLSEARQVPVADYVFTLVHASRQEAIV
jgi:hypothetical protein